MLLMIGLMIAAVSTYTEIKLVHGSKALDRLYTHGLPTPWGQIEGVYFNTAGSFLLSYLVGIMFGASGVTVMFGGALSTGLSQMYFSAEGFAQDRGWSLKSLKESGVEWGGKARSAKDSTVRVYNDFRQPVQDFGRLVLIVLRFITLPFALLRKASAEYSAHRG